MQDQFTTVTLPICSLILILAGLILAQFRSVRSELNSGLREAARERAALRDRIDTQIGDLRNRVDTQSGWAVVGGSHHNHGRLRRYRSEDGGWPSCRGHADAGGNSVDRYDCSFGGGLLCWSRADRRVRGHQSPVEANRTDAEEIASTLSEGDTPRLLWPLRFWTAPDNPLYPDLRAPLGSAVKFPVILNSPVSLPLLPGSSSLADTNLCD